MHIFFIFLNIAFRENGSLGLHSFSDHLDNERKCSDYVITCEGLQVYASEPSNVNISHLFFLNLVLIMYCVVYSVISFLWESRKRCFMLLIKRVNTVGVISCYFRGVLYRVKICFLFFSPLISSMTLVCEIRTWGIKNIQYTL